MKVFKKEWQGTQIDLVNTSKRCELRIDGKTQDFIEGLFPKKGTSLNGTNANGDKIKITFKLNLILTTYIIYYNEKEIYSGYITAM